MSLLRRVLSGLACALAALLLAAPMACGQGWTDAKPVAPPATPEPEETGDSDASPPPQTETEAEAGTDGEAAADESPEQPLRRPRPVTSAAELDWIDEHAKEDPFLQPFVIGPAPETIEFYDPFEKLRQSGLTVQPQACRYLVQGAGGSVLGQLTLRITREQSPLYGPMFHIAQTASIGMGEQVDLWMSSVSNKPLRVERRRDFGGAAPDAHGVVVKNLERLDAKYLFDRVTVVKTRGGVTLAAPTRLQYSCFDVAQLPLLLQLLDYASTDWPFEALLFDTTSLELLPLQVGRPARADVLSAEPATCACWEIPVRWGDQQLKWYVERQAPRRLVKFEFAGMVFTLQDYAELKG